MPRAGRFLFVGNGQTAKVQIGSLIGIPKSQCPAIVGGYPPPQGLGNFMTQHTQKNTPDLRNHPQVGRVFGLRTAGMFDKQFVNDS